jgi:hypothetical protein
MTSFSKCPKCGYEHNPHPIVSRLLYAASPEYQHWVGDLGIAGSDDVEFLVLVQEHSKHSVRCFQFFWDENNIYLYNPDFDSDKPVNTACSEEWLDIDKDPSKALWNSTQPWEDLVAAIDELTQKIYEANQAGNANITPRQQRLCLKTNFLN